MPIAWPRRPDGSTLAATEIQHAAENLAGIAGHLAELEARTGRLIFLCLEPEPGCYLQRGEDVVRFFQEELLPGRDEKTIRRFLRVCHDVCHAAVMFENQEDVLEGYHRAGIEVGKVQVSSAVRVPLPRLSFDERRAALQQLAGFHEPRYLHQTMIRPENGTAPEFFEDLDRALASKHFEQTSGEWRTHFHVPIYLERFGLLEATQDAILSCLRWTRRHSACKHFEVETYAWGVLPPELHQPNLALGIAEEMKWFANVV